MKTSASDHSSKVDFQSPEANLTRAEKICRRVAANFRSEWLGLPDPQSTPETSSKIDFRSFILIDFNNSCPLSFRSIILKVHNLRIMTQISNSKLSQIQCPTVQLVTFSQLGFLKKLLLFSTFFHLLVENLKFWGSSFGSLLDSQTVEKKTKVDTCDLSTRVHMSTSRFLETQNP